MRILIDLQGSQSGSRHRGIGRYTSALAKAIVRNRGSHDVFILLSGLFPESIDDIKAQFSSILSEDHFIVFSAPSPVEGLVVGNEWRMQAAELIREAAINDLAPDVLLIMSLFEGAIDNAVSSICRFETSVKTVVILYDLIPLMDPGQYLTGPPSSTWYYSKVDSLRKADLLLAISDSARIEATDALGFDASRVITIYSAADERFVANVVSAEEDKAFLERFGIRRKFIMHTSAFEPRKNFDGLVRAFCRLPERVRKDHQLVLVAAIALSGQIALRRLADEAGLGPDELVFAGYVSDSELISLYSLCTLFVFPSFHEGFGLPALEAMCCGAAVIGSNTTSIPEVIGKADALFDPHSDASMTALIEWALTDFTFWKSLKAHARTQSKVFNWDRSAILAIRAIEGMATPQRPDQDNAAVASLLELIANIKVAVPPTQQDWMSTADSITKNRRTVQQYRPLRGKEPDTGPEKPNSVRCGSYAQVTRDDGYEGIAAHGLIVEELRQDVWLRDDQPRILLLKLDHIGDFIVALDAFRLFRETWPKAHISLVCGPWNQSLAEQSGLFDVVHRCSFFAEAGVDYDRQTLLEQGLAKYRGLGLGIYDLAVDLRYYGDSRILLSNTNAKYRAGYAAVGVPLDLALPEVPETEMKAHVGARVMALAGAVAWTFGVNLELSRTAMLNGRPPIRSFPDGKVIGIASGTGNPIKSWGRERFAELARLLNRRSDYRFVLIGAERDRGDCSFISEHLSRGSHVNLAGSLAIGDLPPVVAGLDLFIGNDSGTTHMAASMGIPTVCLFAGQSHVQSWRPNGKHVITLRAKVDCSPCYLVKLENCLREHQCMDISPTHVAAVAEAFVERRSPTPVARWSLNVASATTQRALASS
jgi:ADP-heptose:LPS heptosyltransferase